MRFPYPIPPYPIPFVALSLVSATAGAQANPGGARLVEKVTTCRAIAKDQDRLACFDGAAASLADAVDAGGLLILDRQKLAERRRARFGLPIDDGDGRDQPSDETDELRQMTSTVSGVQPSGYERFNMTLANGSVWQTTEPMRFPPKTGEAVTIRTAAFGAFKAALSERVTVKVKRVR